MPQVSVVVPVYNGEKYVVQSINSILNQTFRDTEIIIVNDASQDNSEKVIYENFGDLINSGKIKYTRNEKNQGRNISGNIGAKLASGDYIFFLDADDLWKENHIEEILKIFEGQNPDIVFARPRTFIDETGNIKRKSKSKIPKDFDYIIFSSKIGFPSATAFKKNTFIFYNSEYKFREDIELFIRARLSGQKIVIVDTDTVLIREHSAPTRMSKSSNFYKYTLKLYEDYKDKIPVNYRGNFYFHISEVAFKFGDFKTGYSFLFKALKVKPSLISDGRFLLTFLKRGFRIDRLFFS